MAEHTFYVIRTSDDVPVRKAGRYYADNLPAIAKGAYLTNQKAFKPDFAKARMFTTIGVARQVKTSSDATRGLPCEVVPVTVKEPD
jgi:hypothetical protein